MLRASAVDADPRPRRHRRGTPQRFFAGVTPESIADLRQAVPRCLPARSSTRPTALLAGGSICWDIETCRSATRSTGSSIRCGRGARRSFTGARSIRWIPALVGDSKIAWELNRHQWVVRLAQAFAITGDDRYATAAVDAIDHWIDANPVGRGLNWASSLEVAFRLIAWTLGVGVAARLSGACRPTFTTQAVRGDPCPRRARPEISVLLLLSEYASHGRSARVVLRRHDVSAFPGCCRLARHRRANPDRPDRGFRSPTTASTSSNRPVTSAIPASSICISCCLPRAPASPFPPTCGRDCCECSTSSSRCAGLTARCRWSATPTMDA